MKLVLRNKKYVVYDDDGKVVIITHHKGIAIKYAKEQPDASRSLLQST